MPDSLPLREDPSVDLVGLAPTNAEKYVAASLVSIRVNCTASEIPIRCHTWRPSIPRLTGTKWRDLVLMNGGGFSIQLRPPVNSGQINPARGQELKSPQAPMRDAFMAEALNSGPTAV